MSYRIEVNLAPETPKGDWRWFEWETKDEARRQGIYPTCQRCHLPVFSLSPPIAVEGEYFGAMYGGPESGFWVGDDGLALCERHVGRPEPT